MTPEERKLAELVVLKRDLAAQLKEATSQVRELAKLVDLPMIAVLNGDAVHVSKPRYNDLPICSVARCVR
jgi:hypothetical protein